MTSNSSKRRIVLQGKEEDLKSAITVLIGIKQLIETYDLGHWVGYPVHDFAKNWNEALRLKLIWAEQKHPPWRPIHTKWYTMPECTISSVKKSAIDWKNIRTIMGGSTGYSWGTFRATGTIKGKEKRRAGKVRIQGNSAKEAEKMLREVMKLSSAELGNFTVSEMKISNVSPRYQAKKVYPAFFVVSNNGYDANKVGSKDPPKPKVKKFPVWMDEPPAEFLSELNWVLSNKFDYE